MVVIESEADVLKGVKALRRKCRHMRLMHDLSGTPPLRRREPGFEGLARIVVAQQLSVASAAAIWSRFETAVQPMSAEGVLRLDETALRAAGLSGPKIRTLQAVSRSVADGLDLERLDGLSDEEVHAALTAISGIGPWTADIFLMFCLGRKDAFAAGDLALQVAAQIGMGLEQRPTTVELLEIAERWRPWRSVAARILWHYYKVAKAPKSGLPV